MKSMTLKLRTILAWAALCTAISLMTIPSAHAISFISDRFAFLCGTVNSEPAVVHVNGEPRNVVVSTTTTVLKGKVNGKNRLRHFIIVKLVRPDNSVVWTRSLTIQSLAIATVLSTNPPAYFIAEALSIPDRSSSPVTAFPTECLGVGVVESGGTPRITIALGTSAASGGSIPTTQAGDSSAAAIQAVGSTGTEAVVKGQDKSIINVWMLNVDNGKIARTFKPRAKPNWFFLPVSSGVFDIDADGNDELVIVRARFVGEDRYDYMYESYNIISGALENTTTTLQNNKLIMQ